MKKIMMILSWRQVNFQVLSLIWLSLSVSYVNYNTEESEVAFKFCQKVPSTYFILQSERKNSTYSYFIH